MSRLFYLSVSCLLFFSSLFSGLGAQVREVYGVRKGQVVPNPEFIQPYYSSWPADYGKPYVPLDSEEVVLDGDTFLVEMLQFKGWEMELAHSEEERVYQIARISCGGEVQAELRNEASWDNLKAKYGEDRITFPGLIENPYFLKIPFARGYCALLFYGFQYGAGNPDLSIVVLHRRIRRAA